jgi:hypothetical protein
MNILYKTSHHFMRDQVKIRLIGIEIDLDRLLICNIYLTSQKTRKFF